MSVQRSIGTAFETETKRYMLPVWPECERTGSAAFEVGDLKNTDAYVVECKRHKELRLSAWIKQVRLAAARVTGGKYPVVVAKRRGANVAGSYVVMELETFRQMIADAKGIDLSEEE